MHKLHPIRESFEQRFWKHVRKTDTCWLWTGFLDSNGRGNLRRGRHDEGFVGAQRASWIIHNGPIPDGKSVLHHCDVGHCVRPDHLYVGTQQDNGRDVRERKRAYWTGKGHLIAGDKNPHSKLNWDNVRAIRESAAIGEHLPALAKLYGVTKENIYLIVKNKSWVTPSCV